MVINRLKLLTVGLFILGIIIVWRLFEIQVLDRSIYATTAYTRSSSSQIIPAERGKIFIYEDEKAYPLAVNTNKYNLIASPAEIEDPNDWIKKMAPYLGIDDITVQEHGPLLIQEGQETEKLKTLLTRISQKNDFYELLKKEISADEVEQIRKLELDGIWFETIPGRYYPEGSIFAHIIGFLSQDQACSEKDLSSGQCTGAEGQYGLEEFFNEELSGTPGQYKVERAPGGYLITSSDNIIKSPKNGHSLVLTIDRSIQFFACQTLKNAIDEYDAESGSIIVLNPETGAVLGLCNEPSFDPNYYFEQENFAVFKNPSISSVFEPGSVFKVITMAAGLDAKKITPDTTYKDTGSVTIEDYTITNVDEEIHGIATMTNVLEKSINTGAVFAVQSIGRKTFRNYLKKFGFGGLTGIELAGEATGNIDNLEKRSETYLATASFGHGISVTPIQMITAIASIANSGKLIKPYIIDSIIQDSSAQEGGKERNIEPRFIRQVISPSSAATLTAMMVSVLENGYGRRAIVDGYFVAGKTGTAQVPKKGTGYTEDVIHSFVGFAPATNPKFVALVKLDNPKIGRFADKTAAPTFGKIAEFILKYYSVPPDKITE